MARLDDLISEIENAELRAKLREALRDLRSRKRFGLVFEEHVPEMTSIFGLPLVPGCLVQNRAEPGSPVYRVIEFDDANTTVESLLENEQLTLPTKNLIVVKRFGDPIYPALTHLGVADRGSDVQPHHCVINGENFHVLQLLLYIYRGQVDCIYIDPPYNTGARDWKYNNRYVDDSDGWRHSKWLSMMEKRLQLARRLLTKMGVLIVTIDEHEVNHLGMLLERVFPEYLRHLVTIVHNPKGTYRRNFARVEEYAFFVAPDPGFDVINPTEEGLFAQAKSPEMMADSTTKDTEDLYLRRRGQESGSREKRPNQFYAIYVDEDERKVVGIGPKLAIDDKYDVTERNGSVVPAYPLDTRNEERVWRYNRETMQSLIDNGEIVVTGFSRRTGQKWVLNHRKPKNTAKRHKTVWWERRHDAGAHGSDLLSEYLGESALFPFPKSVYSVRDCLAAVVKDKPDALILDFFAGSGTTLHATCLLNIEDNGHRRSIMVTNNEVAPGEAKKLNKSGYFVGDPEYEQEGIFQRVTWPRSEAVILGVRPDGQPVEGDHTWAERRPYSDGFEETVDFFQLDYLDPDDVELGQQFAAIHPALWAAAGSVGPCPMATDMSTDYFISEASNYGVLFRESRFREFKSKIMDKGGSISHAWLVTNSEEAFAEMRSALPESVKASMLYRDYLLNFEINRLERIR